MRKNIFTIISLIILIASADAQNADSSDLFRQYTSWSLTAGPNLGGYRYNLQSTDYAPDYIRPALGADAGAAISYHITRNWRLQMTALATIERARIVTDEPTAVITTGGTDIMVQAGYSFDLNNISLQLLAGPYTHFIVFSHSSNHSVANPYSRTNTNNPRTDNPIFALGDLCAGAAMTLAVHIDRKWQMAVDLKWGITDLLNVDSHKLHVRPYKITLRASYSL